MRGEENDGIIFIKFIADLNTTNLLQNAMAAGGNLKDPVIVPPKSP